MWRVWSSLAWHDILTRYRRSTIGPFWLTLSVAIFVTALGGLYHTLFRMDVSEYMPFMTAGLVVWTLMSAFLLESCVIFVEGDPIIKQVRLPLTVFVFRMIMRNLIVFLHNLPILVVVFLVFQVDLTWKIVLAPIGLAFLCLNAIWAGLLIGVVSTRYRDVVQVMTSLLQVVFFVTPVFWSPTLLQGRPLIVEGNVLYHFLEVVRGPLLGQVPSTLTYGIVSGVTVVGWTAGLLMFQRFRNRIAYWL